MIPNYQSDALRRLSLGSHDPKAIQTDAIGRVAYRANQDRKNFSQVAPGPDTTGLPPAIAGRLAGGTPNYRDPNNIRQHLMGSSPYAR